MAVKYEFGGSKSVVEKQITGTDSDIIFTTQTDNSLGKNSLGKQPIGSITDSPSDLSKFRVINEITKTSLDFYEVQVVYETNEVDQEWQLLATGPNAALSTSDNTDIKQ